MMQIADEEYINSISLSPHTTMSQEGGFFEFPKLLQSSEEMSIRRVVLDSTTNTMIKAIRVKPLSEMTIEVLFSDNTIGSYTIIPKNDQSILWKLKDNNLFKKAKVAYNGSAIVRDKDIDLDARNIYMKITNKDLYSAYH